MRRHRWLPLSKPLCWIKFSPRLSGKSLGDNLHFWKLIFHLQQTCGCGSLPSLIFAFAMMASSVSASSVPAPAVDAQPPQLIVLPMALDVDIPLPPAPVPLFLLHFQGFSEAQWTLLTFFI